MASPPAPSAGPFATLPPPAQWLLLIAFAAALGVALDAIDFPAALLIGPMLVGMENPVQVATMASTASDLVTLAVLAAGGIAQ